MDPKQENQRYRNWCCSLWESDLNRIHSTIQSVIEKDKRMVRKNNIRNIIATEFPTTMDDIIPFRDSYLKSKDDDRWWVGVALNNALTILYKADFGDDVPMRSCQENEDMSKYLYNTRDTVKTENLQPDVYVTPETFAEKSNELRAKK